MSSILVSLILLIQGIPAQQGGTVSGVLRDSLGMPAPGVRMAAVARPDARDATADATTMAALAETDAEGRFTLENIPPGRYAIAAGRLDLQTYYPGTQELTNATVVTITPGTMVSGVNFVLSDNSVGRAQSGLAGVINRSTTSIPVRVTSTNGKLPISAGGRFTSVRLESSGTNAIMSLKGREFTVPGPVAANFRVIVENLPDNYVVKSITYGSTDITQGTFQLTPANFPVAFSYFVSSARPTAQASLQASTIAGAQVVPLGTAAPISITLDVVTPPSVSGVRVSGSLGNVARRLLYISGTPGVLFSDGTFEFHGVPPGRHVIAAPGNPSTPLAAQIVVGDTDVSGVELKETPVVPENIRIPKDPLPALGYTPGTTVPLAQVSGIVLEEATRTPISEGQVVISSGNSSRTVPITAGGRFETFHLLPGAYDFKLQVFGHSTTGPTIVVDDKDLTLELTTRRLY